MAAGLRRHQRPALGQRHVVGQGGQVCVRWGIWTQLPPRGGLSVGEGDPLQVDRCFHGLEQDIPLFGVELETPLAGLTPPPCLEGEGGLKTGKKEGVEPDLKFKILTLF